MNFRVLKFGRKGTIAQKHLIGQGPPLTNMDLLHFNLDK